MIFIARITQRELARHLGITQPLVNKLVGEGIVPRDGTLDDLCQAYWQHKVSRQRTEADSLTDERIRLTRAQATKAELEVEVLRGNLVPTAMVEQEFTDLVVAARSKLLSLPSRAAGPVMAAANIREAEVILKTMVNEALAELSRTHDHTVPARGPGPDIPPVDSATDADDQPVGGRESPAKPRRQRRTRPVQ